MKTITAFIFGAIASASLIIACASDQQKEPPTARVGEEPPALDTLALVCEEVAQIGRYLVEIQEGTEIGDCCDAEGYVDAVYPRLSGQLRDHYMNARALLGDKCLIYYVHSFDPVPAAYTCP